MIPQTFEQWKHCIVKECRIELTTAFAQQRLAVYEDPGHRETIKFAELYGQLHLQHVIHWFRQVAY